MKRHNLLDTTEEKRQGRIPCLFVNKNQGAIAPVGL